MYELSQYIIEAKKKQQSFKIVASFTNGGSTGTSREP